MKFEDIDRAKELKDKIVNIEKMIMHDDIFITAGPILLKARSVTIKKGSDNFKKILEILSGEADKACEELASLQK